MHRRRSTNIAGRKGFLKSQLLKRGASGRDTNQGLSNPFQIQANQILVDGPFKNYILYLQVSQFVMSFSCMSPHNLSVNCFPAD